MQDAFGIVIVVVVVVAAIAAVITVVGSGRVYDDIGGSGIVRDPNPQAEVGARDEEIRQMLRARNARRARQGKDPLDIEAELRALNARSADPQLAVEVRQLVEARNARRARQGKDPLDVEAEVERRLRELTDG